MPSFTLTTGGSSNSGNDLNLGASETWTVSGSGSSQVSSTVISGPVSVSPSSAAGGSDFTITASSTTTGSYTVRFVQNVGGGRGGSTSYQGNITGSVVSTPATPSYAVSVVNNMNEGTSQTVTVTTSNVSNGTVLYFSFDQAGDFSATDGAFSINNNSGSFTIIATADSTTEGNETKTLRVRTGSTGGTIVGTRSFTVIDTSTTPAPTYSISAANMNEGTSQNVSVTTTNFGSGTLYWSIDGGTDFSATSGSVSISGNSGTISITATADSTTEGNESKTIRLRTGSTSGTQVASDTFTVVDTSTTPAPTYSLGSMSSLNEGSYQNVSVTTTNFGSGTLYYTLSPSADFTTSSGSVSISNNSGSITVTASDDSSTEGAETGTLRLRTGSTSGTVVATRTFTINDTSTGGSSGSGGSGTGSGTGGDTYGIEIYGPNGSTTVLGNNLRAQSVIYFATSTFNNNQTYTITGIPNANDSSKTQIIADFLGGNTNVPITIVRYSNYFTIKHTGGGTRSARLVVIRIA